MSLSYVLEIGVNLTILASGMMQNSPRPWTVFHHALSLVSSRSNGPMSLKVNDLRMTFAEPQEATYCKYPTFGYFGYFGCFLTKGWWLNFWGAALESSRAVISPCWLLVPTRTDLYIKTAFLILLQSYLNHDRTWRPKQIYIDFT